MASNLPVGVLLASIAGQTEALLGISRELKRGFLFTFRAEWQSCFPVILLDIYHLDCLCAISLLHNNRPQFIASSFRKSSKRFTSFVKRYSDLAVRCEEKQSSGCG